MVTFEDGPARPAMLKLRRAPVLLRVVEKPHVKFGRFDALDMFDDEPRPEETIHVYVRVGQPGMAHVDYKDRHGRRRGESRLSARYRLYAHQPDDADARDNHRWRDWCEAQRPTLVKQGAL